jgi:hypothetical protein
MTMMRKWRHIPSGHQMQLGGVGCQGRLRLSAAWVRLSFTNSESGGQIITEIEDRVAAAANWDSLDKSVPR